MDQIKTNLTILIAALMLLGCQGPEASDLNEGQRSASFTQAELSIVAIERADQLVVRGFATNSDYPGAHYYTAAALDDGQFDLQATDCSVPNTVVYVFECFIAGDQQLVVSTQQMTEGVVVLVDQGAAPSFTVFRFEPQTADTGIVPVVVGEPI